MSGPDVLEGLLDLLREACEGGAPGEGTGFLDGTKADGSGNKGLFATLDGLDAARASNPTALRMSVASQAAHVAYHLEVTLRWERGERGPFDWKGSFEPARVGEAEWAATRARVRGAYAALVVFARSRPGLDRDAATSLAAALSHVAYHLGALRQIVKLA